jgi:hypothetical protein
MSEERELLIEIRLTGAQMIPGTVKSRELAEVIRSVEEMIASVVPYQNSSYEKDQIVVGLASVQGGSIRLGFKSLLAPVVVMAYFSVANAVKTENFSTLPPDSRNALKKIVTFTRNHQCVAELLSPHDDTLIASITPTTTVDTPGLVRGETTLYGRILRVGGKTPHVMFETVSGATIYCDTSFKLAQELGHRLYEFAEISGTALWDPTVWHVREFRIESFVPSGEKTAEETIAELSRLVGRYFEDVDDVESYVSSIRSEPENI